MIILDGEKTKTLTSKYYNYIFFKQDVFDKDNKLVAPAGFFARWGENKEDDPDFSPFGPEILDCELSTGDCIGSCRFCYKNNGSGHPSKHMSLDTFKEFLSRMPRTLTQIAFGITNIYSNPDFFNIMEHTRLSGLVPNYTTHGLDVDESAAKLTAELCGAVAVSVVNKQKTYDAVKLYTDAGMKQCNIHFMICEESYDKALEVMEDIKNDKRLAKLNAMVLLSLKRKEGGKNFTSLSDKKFKKLVNFALDNDISIGFDSCACHRFLESVKDNKNYEQFKIHAEPCESSCFSSYVSVDAKFYPCSFVEGEKGWEDGLDIINCNDFVKDVWSHPKTVKFRSRLFSNNRNCFMFEV